VEELLVAILQVVLEFALEMLVYIGLDAAAIRDDRSSRPGCALSVIFLVVGGLIAFLTNLIHPKPFLPFPGLRIANLVAAPFAGAGLSWLIARWRGRTGDLAWLHACLAFVFLLGFNVVRFAYARH
jgi:hypothetical protein